MWPFDIKRKKREKELAAAEQARLLYKDMLVLWQFLAREAIDNAIKDFKVSQPQPYKEGDFVDILYYGWPQSLRGWLPTAKAICNHFGKDIPELNGPATLKVKNCYVDCSWLTERLDPRWTDLVEGLISRAKNGTDLKDKFNDYIIQLSKGGPLVEWAIEIDWDYHKFKYDTCDGKPTNKKSHLVIHWEIAANTFIDSRTPLATKQKALYIQEQSLKQAKEFYNQEYESVQENIKALF